MASLLRLEVLQLYQLQTPSECPPLDLWEWCPIAPWPFFLPCWLGPWCVRGHLREPVLPVLRLKRSNLWANIPVKQPLLHTPAAGQSCDSDPESVLVSSGRKDLLKGGLPGKERKAAWPSLGCLTWVSHSSGSWEHDCFPVGTEDSGIFCRAIYSITHALCLP